MLAVGLSQVALKLRLIGLATPTGIVRALVMTIFPFCASGVLVHAELVRLMPSTVAVAVLNNPVPVPLQLLLLAVKPATFTLTFTS